jgi:hypothetical protein
MIARAVEVDAVAGAFVEQRVYLEQCIFEDWWKLHVAVTGGLGRNSDNSLLAIGSRHSPE